MKPDIKLEYYGEVTDGKLNIFNRKSMLSEVRHFEGKKVIVTIERKKKKRSTYQNRYYWGVVIPLIKEGLNDCGIFCPSNDAAHDFIKHHFLTYEAVNEKTGETTTMVGSTTGLTTTEFMDLIVNIQSFAVEFLGTDIPDPNEQLEIHTD